MDLINELHASINPAVQTGQRQAFPSLNEIIAEIDNETRDYCDHDTSGEELSPKSDKMPASLQDQFILFALEKIIFALPLSRALEIGRHPEITPLPNLPNWVLGISNIRGEIISFINLKAFLGIPSSGTHMERRFLIIHNQEMKVGIVVDRVRNIIPLDQIDTDLQKSPYREGDIAKYILGVAVSGKNLTNILAVDKLLSSPRMTGFKAN